MRRLAFIAIFLQLAAIGLSGCNTVRGAGQDIEAAGQEIEEEANENSY